MSGRPFYALRRSWYHVSRVGLRSLTSSARRPGQQTLESAASELLSGTSWPKGAARMVVLDRSIRAQFDLGECTGPDSRYRIARKLGSGQCSDVWLAKDTSTSNYVAIKTHAAWMSDLHAQGIVWEAEAFRRVSEAPHSPHCARLLDEFSVPARDAGKHMCFVMPFYGGDVGKLQRARSTGFPLPLVKRICLHLLRGVAHLHARGVVHTDLMGNNIYYDAKMADADVDAWLQREDAPLAVISDDEAAKATFLLADFLAGVRSPELVCCLTDQLGPRVCAAQPSKLHPMRQISPVALRSPEVYLGAAWDTPADIWSFGCLVYEFITNRMLFTYVPNKKYGLSETENMLYQMILHTGERSFMPDQLTASPRAPEFFAPDCQLKNLKDPECLHWPIEALFPFHGTHLPEDEAAAAATLIRRCLRLNPDDRATAEQLLEDDWFADAA